MSTFFEHPIVQKAAAGLIVAGAAAITGLSWNSYSRLTEHDAQIKQLVEMREDVKEVRKSMVGVERDVAILKDRADRKEANDTTGKTKPVR